MQGGNVAKLPMHVNRWETLNMPQTLCASGFEACHVNRLIDFRKNGCIPKGWNVWGMCVEPQNRFPTLQALYTSAFREICGEWGAQRPFVQKQIRCQFLDSQLKSAQQFCCALNRSLYQENSLDKASSASTSSVGSFTPDWNCEAAKVFCISILYTST